MSEPYGQGPLPPYRQDADPGTPPPGPPPPPSSDLGGLPPPPVPVAPAVSWPSHPHAEPKRYDQILRTWSYAWWRPVVGIAATVACFAIVVPVLLLPIIFLGAALQDGSFGDNVDQLLTLDDASPWAMLYLNLSIAGSIIAVFVIMRLLHRMRPRWLGSVVPGLRWNLILIFMGPAFAALVAAVIVNAVLSGVTGSSSDADVSGGLNDFTPTAAWMLLVVLLTTPLQAAGEEYVFRGYLLQAVGSFVRRPWGRWLAICVTATVFALAHGGQDLPLFFDRFAFGFIAGWLTIRTGGLEAGIAMHVLNNYLAFLSAIFFGDLSESLSVSDVPWWNVFVTITQSGVYAALCLLIARQMRLQTKTAPAWTPAAASSSS